MPNGRGNDFVIGYRWRRAEASRRQLNAWAWGKLVQLVLGVKVRDLDCAFKLFRRDVIDRLQLTATGACINAEIMAQCVRAGLRYVETPVNHYPRSAGVATGSNLKVIVRAFRELPRLRKYCKGAQLLGPHRPPVASGGAAASEASLRNSQASLGT